MLTWKLETATATYEIFTSYQSKGKRGKKLRHMAQIVSKKEKHRTQARMSKAEVDYCLALKSDLEKIAYLSEKIRNDSHSHWEDV